MPDTAIAAGLRAAIAAALPAYADRSERPAAAAEEGLPAFALLLDRDAAEPAGMGSPRQFVSATVTVAAFVRGADPRAAARAALEEVRAAVASAGRLGGLIWSGPDLTSTQIDIAPGASPLGQAVLRYSLRFLS